MAELGRGNRVSKRKYRARIRDDATDIFARPIRDWGHSDFGFAPSLSATGLKESLLVARRLKNLEATGAIAMAAFNNMVAFRNVSPGEAAEYQAVLSAVSRRTRERKGAGSPQESNKQAAAKSVLSKPMSRWGFEDYAFIAASIGSEGMGEALSVAEALNSREAMGAIAMAAYDGERRSQRYGPDAAQQYAAVLARVSPQTQTPGN